MKLYHLLTTLAINAVPAAGWFLGDWTSGTTVAVYWVETVLATLFVAARIVAHRRLVPARGHFRYRGKGEGGAARQQGTFLGGFLLISLVFSAAHAVFLGAMFGILSANGQAGLARLNMHDLGVGCGLILLFQTVDLLIDLLFVGEKPFRWVELQADRNLGRVIVVHLAIIFGLLAAGLMGGPRGFFLVFVILKTMNDLNGIVPQYEPAEPPRWLCWLMDKVPARAPEYRGKTFREFWVADIESERRRIAENDVLVERA